jgi:hypothetical protein
VQHLRHGLGRRRAGASSAFVYGCSQCHGFYAHPGCAILPQTTMLDTQHGHTLTLLSPPRWSSRRKCINTAQKCPNTKRLNSDARSYQCNLCNVELCLECQLATARRRLRSWHPRTPGHRRPLEGQHHCKRPPARDCDRNVTTRNGLCMYWSSSAAATDHGLTFVLSRLAAVLGMNKIWAFVHLAANISLLFSTETHIL